MHPAVRALGKLLRLVGISSPEDTMPNSAREKDPSGPPSWRSTPEQPAQSPQPPQPNSSDTKKPSA
ncbi:MAG TPA: hypothetical protein VNW54_08880 [Granulicella sp.]|jgi:hypothetical protein|nr:hypothetical protein [Granulicella sp.]